LKIFSIFGPTASGKTNLSIELAKKINGEIIGVDSRQIYKHIAIGTAQPDHHQLSEVKHYLIGELNLDQKISAGKYMNMIDKAISNIIHKNKIPILCGGTGLYLKTLKDGIFSGSKTNLSIRKNLEKKYDSGNMVEMLEELKKIDPTYAEKVHVNNRQRLIRALEVFKITGKPISENFQSENKKSIYSENIETVFLKNSLINLEKSISQRIDLMFENGIVEEVLKIKEMDLDISHIKYIGYKEVCDLIDRKISLTEAKEVIYFRTRQYAKRQLKWFNNQQFDYVIELEVDKPNRIVELLAGKA